MLPWICAATAPLRLRNLTSAYPRAISTAKKMISAITSVISYNVSISLALGDAPLAGVKNASSVGRCPKAGRILFRPGRYALDDECHEGRRRRRATAAAVVGGGCLVASATAETRRSPLPER